MHEHKHIQEVFIRTAQDGGFAMSGTDVAIFVGKLLGCSPFTVCAAFGNMDTMNAVATGTHPAAKKVQNNG
jgi:hypothetical protein